MEAAVPILIFAIALVLILSERIHRTIVALLGAGAMIAAGKLLDFYDEEKAFLSIDFNTIGLLLGMMILVVLLARTGFFEYLAIVAGQLSGGRPWRLLLLLGITTGIVSMFLDNVTTIILIAPVTLQIASLLRMNPVPLLIGEALLSNTMGAATLVGDPPNILIGSAASLSFSEFLVHLGPVALVATGVTLVALRLTFAKELAKPAENVAALMRMQPRNSLRDEKNLRKILIIIALVVIGFFLHGSLHILPATVALIGAGLALAWIRPSVEEVLRDVEWSVLLFFTGLFVMVGGLEGAEVLSGVASVLVSQEASDPILMSVTLIWTASIISALVDNIPFTIAAIPIVETLGDSVEVGNALWWALALGSGFGGNGTPIGSTAGVVAVHMSEKTDTPITLRAWLLSGTVAAVVASVIATLAFVLFFDFFR